MMHTILEEGLQNEEYIRELTDDFDAVREIVMRYSPEDAEKITGVPGRGHPRDRARVRERAARGDLLHPRDHRARVRRRQHLVALEPRAHDRPPRLRVDGAERAPRPEQRPGAERLGREPVLPPRLPVGRRSRDPAEVLRRLGRRGSRDGPATASTRSSPACTTGASRRSTSSARTRRRPSRTRATSRKASRASTSSCRRTSS